MKDGYQTMMTLTAIEDQLVSGDAAGQGPVSGREQAEKMATGAGRAAVLSSRLARLAVTGAALFGLGGCASYFGAQVTSYHQPDEPLAGQSFRFAPSPQQADSLEYQTYAAQVREKLLQHGLLTTAEKRHDLNARLDYSTDGGRPVTYTEPRYDYVFQGYRTVQQVRQDANGQQVVYWDTEPVWGYDLVGYSTYQRTIYRHQLRLSLARTKPEPGKPANIFESTVITDTQDGALNNVVPLMIEALFQEFPGPNGVSRQVKIETDPGLFGSHKDGDQAREKGQAKQALATGHAASDGTARDSAAAASTKPAAKAGEGAAASTGTGQKSPNAADGTRNNARERIRPPSGR